jgi:hypothetical protein
MIWMHDFESLVTWALRSIDLRYSFYFAKSAAAVSSTPGLFYVPEPLVNSAIFEAYLGKGYVRGSSVDLEHAYPSSTAINPKRADLAFKDGKVGSKWAFVETKYWNSNTSAIDSDIMKLVNEKSKISRWLLLYRVRPVGNATLESLILKRLYPAHLIIEESFSFDTTAVSAGKNMMGNPTTLFLPGKCDVCLCRVK